MGVRCFVNGEDKEIFFHVKDCLKSITKVRDVEMVNNDELDMTPEVLFHSLCDWFISVLQEMQSSVPFELGHAGKIGQEERELDVGDNETAIVPKYQVRYMWRGTGLFFNLNDCLGYAHSRKDLIMCIAENEQDPENRENAIQVVKIGFAAFIRALDNLRANAPKD